MECPICFTELDTDNKYTFLCFHAFCKRCIRNWLETRKLKKLPLNCPTCRKVKKNSPNKINNDVYYNRFTNVKLYDDESDE